MKIALTGVALALFLLAGVQEGRPDTAPVPVSAPAQVGRLDQLAPPSSGEAARPPAPTPEQEVAAVLGQAWDATKWGAGGALVVLAILAALVVGSERSRYR